jgi:general secretion pathway protein F
VPAYSFEALQADGQTRKGVIEADTARLARAQLRGQALVPLAVEPVTGRADSLLTADRRRAAFGSAPAGHLDAPAAGLVGSGLPLERRCRAGRRGRGRAPAPPGRRAARRGQRRRPLARAMAQHPREFSTVYTAVIAAGEQGGHLGAVLERLADDLEERQALKAKLIGAALYPAIVTLVAIVIVVFLVSYVVPQVATVFAGTKRALPTLTVAMLAISAFVRHWGWWLLGAIVLIAAGARWALTIDSFARNSTPPGCACRWSGAWRAATTRRALAAPGHAGGRRRAHPARAAGRRQTLNNPPCAPTPKTRWCWCAARRWPRRWRRKSAFRASCPCSRAWASRPASCR